ncbi:hypothetical protein MACH09_39750 [Vibrio sp. MACH09]|uniref:HNH endonuclease n=1 Tax=Vibrio sp. MACH09 TaxID=3025122 RepID=UPI00278FAD38|nr:HNH endonuclease [Vibrio sp. MACH09]GLO63467.1 hypothetical protein MACH09_39750 [Vibrio sp. MACH09]
MKLIESHEQLESNIREFDKLRKFGTNEEKSEVNSLIRRGTCFIPYVSDDCLYFAPSRFVGYVGNTLKKHNANNKKDGRLTNREINNILGTRALSYSYLEKAYISSCGALGFEANASGNFGVRRKYWLTTDIEEFCIQTQEAEIGDDPSLDSTEREQLIKSRVGQGKFRDLLIKFWSTCCVTKCSQLSLLRASHIKPWRDCDNKERIDRYNGFLLTPNLDLLFDKGFISFDKAGNIMISKSVSKHDFEALGLNDSLSVSLVPEHEKYLSWHRKNIYAYT